MRNVKLMLAAGLASLAIHGSAHAQTTFDFSVTAGTGGGTLFSGTLANSDADATTEGTHTFTGVSGLSAFSPNGSSLGTWGSGTTNLDGTYTVSYTVSGGAVTFNNISFNFGSSGVFNYSSSTGKVYIAEDTLPGSWACDVGAGCKFAGITTSDFSTVTASNTTFTQSISPVPEIDGSKLPIAGFIVGSFMLWLGVKRRRSDAQNEGFANAAFA